jgi:hypothetical protein
MEPGEEDTPEDLTIFPEGTTIHPPEDGVVAIQFPSVDDAIVFYELLRALNSGEIALEVVRQS